jgi:hypothetical protein
MGNWAITPGTTRTATGRRTRSARRSLMPGACMIRTGTNVSGVPTFTARIHTPVRKRPIPPGRPTACAACCVAARAATFLCIAGPRAGTSACRTAGTASSGSVWSWTLRLNRRRRKDGVLLRSAANKLLATPPLSARLRGSARPRTTTTRYGPTTRAPCRCCSPFCD